MSQELFNRLADCTQVTEPTKQATIWQRWYLFNTDSKKKNQNHVILTSLYVYIYFWLRRSFAHLYNLINRISKQRQQSQHQKHSTKNFSECQCQNWSETALSNIQPISVASHVKFQFEVSVTITTLF